LETGEITRSADIGKEGAATVAVNADGNIAIVSPGGDDPLIWDVDAWQMRHILKGNGSALFAVSLTTDGSRALVGSGHGLALWDTHSGKRLKKIRSRGKDEVNAVALTTDGSEAVTGWNSGAVILYDLENSKIAAKLGHHYGAVWAVAVSRDGRFVITGADDSSIGIWDLTKSSEPVFRYGHTSIVRSLAIAPDSKHYWSASGDCTMKLWHRRRRYPLCSVQAHNGYIRGLALSSDGNEILTAADDGTARLWDQHDIKNQKWPEPHGGRVTFVGILPGGKQVISSSWDGGIHLRDAATGLLVRSLHDGYSQIRSAAMTPDGKCMFFVGDDDAFTFRPPEGDPVEIGFIEMPDLVAITSDGKLGICGSYYRVVTLWDLEHGKRKRTLLRAVGIGIKHSPAIVYAVALTPDGHYAFASVERSGLHFWDLKKDVRRITVRSNKRDHKLLSTRDGKHLICVTDDGILEIVQVPSFRLVRDFKVGPVLSMALSPSGNFLVTGTPQATVHIWDMAEGTCVATYGADSEISALAIGRDLKSIVIGDDVGRLQMLQLNRLHLA
jgi:WD40 repeat protein